MAQLEDHIEKNHLGTVHQLAYRKHHSCETSIIKICNDILWAMENEKIRALVAINLSAAFDTVDHKILLQTLENLFGINNTALAWYSNYLSNCSFVVDINGEKSDMKTSPCPKAVVRDQFFSACMKVHYCRKYLQPSA